MLFTSAPATRRRASQRFAAAAIAAFLLSAATAQQQQQRGVSTPPKTAISGAVNGTYYALVIGINQYRVPLPTLKTAVNDAQAMARLLSERYGFRSKLLLNGEATRDNILNALDQYRRTLQEGDNLLVYYAGHGRFDTDADKAYWQPADAEAEMSSHWISADDLTTKIRVLAARHVLVVSDSCYSGALTRDGGGSVRPADPNVYLRKMLAGKSRTLMASGGNEPVADGGGAGHSVFANAILRALGGMEAGAFTASDLFYTGIQQQVAGGSEQAPHYSPVRNSGHGDGDFVFIRAGAALKLPAAAASPGPAASGSVSVPSASWEELKEAPPRVAALVAHGKALVAADGSGQVYVSMDSGGHWTPHAMPVSAVPNPRSAVSAPPITTLASCGTYLLAGVYSTRTYNGPAVFVSQDGVSWRATPLNGDRVSAMGCAGSKILASMWPETEHVNGAYRALNLTGNVVGDVVYPTLVLSRDAGHSWELLRKRFDAKSVAVSDQRIEVMGFDGYNSDDTSLEYCYQTSDWDCSRVRSKFSGGFPSVFQRTAGGLFVGTNLGTMMVSANDGKSWKETPLPLQKDTEAESQGLRPTGFPNEVRAMAVAGRRVAAATRDKGVYLSDESGETWSLVGGRPVEGIGSLAYDGTYLYAGTAGGVLKTRLTVPQ